MTDIAARARSAPAPSLARLHLMVRQRPMLAGAFESASARHAQASPAELEAWAEAVLRLANVNAGPVALMAILHLTAAERPRPGVLLRLAETALAATEICRAAGASAIRASLEHRGRLTMLFHRQPRAEAGWWKALIRLAHEAPDCLIACLEASPRILGACGDNGFEAFVATGLSASSSATRRLAFFSLADREAQQTLDHIEGRTTFALEQRRLQAYVSALWGSTPIMRGYAPDRDDLREPRAAVRSGIVRVPDTFRAIPRSSVPRLFRAIVAHATAHLAFGSPCRDPDALKPVQIALVGLIEDARIEALAMQRFPGLRALWAPFHTAAPSPLRTVPVLLARLAHALFDRDYSDDDGFVAKGRAMFLAEPTLRDPTLSRRIGGLLGNDIGQMRVQFDPKSFVVEPVYRDDNLGFWSLPSPPADPPADEIDVMLDRARLVSAQALDPSEADRIEPEDDPGEGRSRPCSASEPAPVIARYPEWDVAAAVERPDWTSVREVQPVHGPVDRLEAALAREAGLAVRVHRLVQSAHAGRPTRLRRQPDGPELDFEAVIDAVVTLRSGGLPNERLYVRNVMQARDLAVLVLVDHSESTRSPAPNDAGSILDVEKLAVAVLARAMAARGDAFALQAFASNGREEVLITRLKDFGQPFDRDALALLSGLAPGLSTRLGAALRHAGAQLAQVAASRRLLIVLSDGVPADIDVPHASDLVEDARRAVLQLRARDIDTFGLTLGPSGGGDGVAVFGAKHHLPVRNIAELPQRLSSLYFRLSRR